MTASNTKVEVGATFRIQGFIVRHPDGDMHYWFLVPESMTREEAFESQDHHGPFATEADAAENQRVVLLGEQCMVRLAAPTSSCLH
jgi:hypothetical protein